MSEVHPHWFWRMMTYPIPLLPPWRRRRISAPTLIEASALPPTAQAKITEVVRRTRLWRHEKAEVAEELIAHFHDGLAAGRTIDELLATFGDAKTAARLIRRGKKRNRPLWWHAQRRIRQAIGLLLLVYVGLMLLLVIRHPNPSIDYVMELNRAKRAMPLADRAWPLYRQAWINARMWDLKDDALYVKDEDGKPGERRARPGDAEWPAAAAFLREHRALFDELRTAGLKPCFGRELMVGGMSPEDRFAVSGSTTQPCRQPPVNRADKLMSESMMSILLPELTSMRQSANLLADDLRLAAAEGDTSRVLANYRALVGMARQCGETKFIINQLVELGIIALADRTLMEINQATPQALAKCRVELLHAMAGVEPGFAMDLSGEKTFMLDTIQRVYSDNGHGDGAPTLDGLKVLMQLGAGTSGRSGQPANTNRTAIDLLQTMSLPAAVAVMASRKEITEQTERLYALGAEDAARPLWVKIRTPGKSDELILSWRTSAWGNIHYAMLALLAPSLDHAGKTFDRSRAGHEAAMVALAIESYRDATGHYPAALANLVPHYFPTLPLDYSTGGPLRYKLVNDKPLLYGLGRDGIDDGGVWRDKKNKWPGIPETGDWVLYPPPRDPD